MISIQSLLFELIRISIGKQKAFSHHTPSAKEWEILYRMAERQAILGICFMAVKNFADSVPQPLYLEWLSLAARIQQRNEEMNRKCAEVYEAICREGFGCVVLKGQGVARFYSESDGDGDSYSKVSDLGMYRQSGDIDVWLWKDGRSLKENRTEIIKYAKFMKPNAIETNHHIAMDLNGIEIEYHYEPAYSFNPFSNRCFVKWFINYDKSRFQIYHNGFCVPDAEFNRVFLLAHAFRHYMSEGLGLRQVMDYYFLLRNLNLDFNLNNDKMIKKLGMARFEKAMKWVIGYVFEGKDIEEGRKCGKMLLEHIMDGGNFGKYKTTTVANKHTHLGRFINQLAHTFQLMRYYPSEAIWVPISMIREFIRIRI